jgi:PAS domain S-box-containing protein
MKILVVDDDEGSRVYLEKGLTSQGHNIKTACNGKDAFDSAKNWNPDLIITDIMMPEMDGFELCRKIREDASLFGVPIIVYTSTYIDSRDEKLAFSLGASKFILKPMDFPDLVEIVNEVLEASDGLRLSVVDTVPDTVPEDKQMVDEEYHQALARKLDKKVRELEEEHRALKVSEAKFRAIGVSANDAIIMIDNDGCISFWNTAAKRLFGYSEEEVVGKKISDLIVPEEFRIAHRNGFEHFKETGQGPAIGKTLEFTAIHKDGKEFPIEHSLSAVKIDGKWNAIGIMRDITERKKAQDIILRQSVVLKVINKVFKEALLCESEAELAKTCLTLAEKLTNSKFGFYGEINEEGLFDTLALTDPGWDACRIPDTDAEKMLVNMKSHGIYGAVLKGGTSRIVNNPDSHPDKVGLPEGHPPLNTFLGIPLKRAGKTIGMIVLGNKESGYDQYDLKAVEAISVAFVEAIEGMRAKQALYSSQEKLTSSYKMASLGRLTAGAFHELLNPVNIISSHIQLLLMEVEKGSKTEEDLESVQEEIKRIVKISDGLMRFARKGEHEEL